MSDKQQVKDQIMKLVRKRGREKTICPSEVARALQPNSWRSLMDQVRIAAMELKEDNRIIIEQHGYPVDLNEVRGPIRLRLHDG